MKCCLRYLPILALMICLGAKGAEARLLPKSAGYVANVVGEAYVTRLGNTNALAEGQAIVEGMTLHTGASGGLAVMLEDGTLMALGPNSRFTLEHYRFQPASETFLLRAGFHLGTLSLTGGAMARLDPGAISLTTPQGRVDVHGGHALLKVAE